ncbi:MAG: stage II sporulation protein M [Pirellulales bacterium]|nr:stage II sporulation protein M [Pirellulales bacterium]
MKVVELLEARRLYWRELEQLCSRLEKTYGTKSPDSVLRLGTLYRAACADLALADAYQLPPNTISYLHQLVARAHNHLYRSRRFDPRAWITEIFVHVPQRLFQDGYLRLAFVLFWGLFITAFFLARNSTDFCENLLQPEMMEQMRNMYSDPPQGRDINQNMEMFTFYIMHNAGIGLECFAWGLLLGIGGLFKTVYNAAYLGGVFGYMASLEGPEREHFFEFVTAHGPFELTAIILAAAAGMRMGFSLISTRGLTRAAALELGAKEAFPTACAAVILFILAASIEGFVSPSAMPYWSKAMIAAISSGLLIYYFVVLGYPRKEAHVRSE